MLSREEQLKHEIEHKEIDAYDAVETAIDLEEYDLIELILNTLEIDKYAFNLILESFNNYCDAVLTIQMLEKIQNKEWYIKFIDEYKSAGNVDIFYDALLKIKDIEKNLKPFIFRTTIDELAGKSSMYLKIIDRLINIMSKDISGDDFVYLSSKSSNRDFANIISDTIYYLDDSKSKVAFEWYLEMKMKTPTASIVLNALEHGFKDEWTIKEALYKELYLKTKDERYLPDAVKTIFIF